jgi:hypothetical protein
MEAIAELPERQKKLCIKLPSFLNDHPFLFLGVLPLHSQFPTSPIFLDIFLRPPLDHRRSRQTELSHNG